MKKIFSLTLGVLILALCCQSASAISKAKSAKLKESLHYNAYWHWGFIWKQAGSGVLKLWDEQVNDSTQRLHGQLCGRSLSIVESIMKVRDTLDCYYTPELIPIEYCKKTNEGSYQAIERNTYRNYSKGEIVPNVNGLKPAEIDSTATDIYRWRIKKGTNRKRVSNPGVGYDMLAIFYLIRHLDYDAMRKGEKRHYYVTAGVKNQQMHIIYKGRETCTLKNGRKYPAYAIELIFSSKDSDSTPIQAWLSTEPSRRPLSVVIQLKRIGSVQGEIVE